MAYNFPLRIHDEELSKCILDMAKQDNRPINTTIALLLEYAIREKTRKRKKNNT